MQLLADGRQVVAAVRSKAKAQVILEDLLATSGSALRVEQVDVTNGDSLSEAVFQGVTQAVIATGPVFGFTPGQGMGFLDGMTPEKVEAEGK
jgi:NAD(P)-dependent dehydrogenase (short-subunit alcohol dehydrogenase family)